MNLHSLLRRKKALRNILLTVVVILCISLLFYSSSSGEPFKKSRFDGDIVFDRAGGGFHIYKISGAVPDKEIRLTHNDMALAGENAEPVWLPGGKQIAFINRQTDGKSKIVVIDSEGKNMRDVASFQAGIIFDLRRDTKADELRFSYNPNKPEADISEKRVNVTTGAITEVASDNKKPAECNRVVLSPDGNALICIKWLSPGKEKFIIYQAELGKRSLTGEIAAKWRKLLEKEATTITWEKRTFRRGAEMIFENASDPLWAKSGQEFAVTVQDRLTICNKNGTEIGRVEALCKNEGAVCLRRWPRAGGKLLYSCYCGAEGIQEKIYLFDLTTKKSSFIAEGQHPDLFTVTK